MDIIIYCTLLTYVIYTLSKKAKEYIFLIQNQTEPEKQDFVVIVHSPCCAVFLSLQ